MSKSDPFASMDSTLSGRSVTPARSSNLGTGTVTFQSPQAAGIDPIPLDMTSAEHRYKLRACLTILHQVNALLREIQANPHPECVPDEYVPYRSLGDDDSILPADVITTPRPLHITSPTAKQPKGSAFDKDDVFSPEDIDETFASAQQKLLDGPEEDGRLTALAVVARNAPLDPRFATIQGLLQHIDQIALEGADPAHPATVYPAWIGPQLAQVLGLINTLYPTPERKRRDQEKEAKAKAFRKTQADQLQQEMNATQFEAFLDKKLEAARERKNKLDELGNTGSGGSSSNKKQQKRRGSSNNGDSDDPFGAHGSSTSRSPSRTGSSTSLKKSGSTSTIMMIDLGFPGSEEADQTKRAENRAAHLQGLSPRSKKAFLAAEAKRYGSRSNPALKDTKHRPDHAKPFGYSSHKKKKIGDGPLDPVTRNTKYDEKPRRAPGLLDPKKVYAIPVNHPRKPEPLPLEMRPRSPSPRKKTPSKSQMGEQQSPYQQQQQEEGEEGYYQQYQHQQQQGNDDPFGNDDSRNDPAYPQQPHFDFPQASSHAQPAAAGGGIDDDDPFAAHDTDSQTSPKPVVAPPSSAARPRSALPTTSSGGRAYAQQMAPQSTKKNAWASSVDPFEESKESALESYRPSPLELDPDDPFAGEEGLLPLKSGATTAASTTQNGHHARMGSTASAKGGARKSVPASGGDYNLPTPSTVNRIIASPTNRRPSTATLDRSMSPSRRGSVATTPSNRKSLSLSNSRKSLSSPSNASAAAAATFSSPSRGAPSGITGDNSSWADVELKLLAMREELKQSQALAQREVQQQVESAFKKLSESFIEAEREAADGVDMQSRFSPHSTNRGLTSPIRSSPSLGNTLSSRGSDESSLEEDMSTMAFDNALNEVLAKGKRVIRADTATTKGLVQTLASTQQELHEERSIHAKLEEEKRHLETALKELQQRDAAHAQSLFILMDKLNNLNSAALSANAAEGAYTKRGGGGTLHPDRGALRKTMRDAAFVQPFGSPLQSDPNGQFISPRKNMSLRTPVTPLTGNRSGGLGSSIHLSSPAEIAAEASHESSFVEGLEDSFTGEQPAARPPQIVLTDDEAAAIDAENRLVELHNEVNRLQEMNRGLKEKLDAATFNVRVSERTAEQQKLFMAQQLVNMTDGERLRERHREESQRKAQQEDLRRIAANERALTDLREEQRALKLKYDSEKTLNESQTNRLLEDIQNAVTQKDDYKREAELMKARYEQILKEQDEMIAAKNAARSGNMRNGNNNGNGPEASSDFFSFLASSFRGDYLKVGHNSVLLHIINQQCQIAYATKLQPQDHEDILFSDYVMKYNRRNTPQQRILVVTSTAIYTFLPKKNELRRRIAINDIHNVSLSRLCTDLIILQHTREHDVLLTTPKRPELVYHLQNAFKNLSRGDRQLSYTFAERLYVKDQENCVRDVQILDSQSFKLGKPFASQGAIPVQ